jgi:hypothetical protein
MGPVGRAGLHVVVYSRFHCRCHPQRTMDTQATEARARQAEALPPVARGKLLNDNESPEAWFKRNARHLAPVWLVEALYDQLAGFAIQINEKGKQRNERLDTLESQVQGLVARAGGETGQESMVEARLTLLCHLRRGALLRKLSSMPSSRRLWMT